MGIAILAAPPNARRGFDPGWGGTGDELTCRTGVAVMARILHVAAASDGVAAMRSLVARGADVEQLGAHEQTPALATWRLSEWGGSEGDGGAAR